MSVFKNIYFSSPRILLKSFHLWKNFYFILFIKYFGLNNINNNNLSNSATDVYFASFFKHCCSDKDTVAMFRMPFIQNMLNFMHFTINHFFKNLLSFSLIFLMNLMQLGFNFIWCNIMIWYIFVAVLCCFMWKYSLL